MRQNHYGGLEVGHYTALAKVWGRKPPSAGPGAATETASAANANAVQWYLFDDEAVVTAGE